MSLKWKGGLSLIIVFFSSANIPVYAEGLADNIDTTLSLRGDVWSGSRHLDDIRGVGRISAWGQFKLKTESLGQWVGGGWVADQGHRDLEKPRSRLRELYWRLDYEPFELKVGRQLVVWGRADGLNPTDNLSQRDFTLLVPEDGDQRYGNDAAQLSINTEHGQFSGLLFAHGASYTLPLQPLANVNYAVDTSPTRPQWAFKWEANGEGVDGSLSYFRGVDPMPDLSIAGFGQDGLTVSVQSHPVQILGADISLTQGDAVWRAEAAWMETESDGAADFLHKKRQAWLVGGAEWTFPNATTFGVQGSLQHVLDFKDPDSLMNPVEREIAWRQAATSHQTAATQVGMTWRLASRWLNDTLMAETSGVVVWPARDGVWRTKLNYALNDHWNFQTGADYYFGPDHSFFGQLSKNSLVYVQLRLS